ncbi:MAG: TonB-dependent receptor plug domain-containing protein [Gemmatimonadaceae bacterium]
MLRLRRTALTFPIALGLLAACAPAHSRAPDSGATLTSDDFRDPNEPIESVIQKKVPGLRVTRTGDGGIALQVRGTSSYSGSETPPLFVLNGLPFTPGPDGALTGINPHDIASIKVLKGAQAGLYGIEGANGVIVITTKKPGEHRP